MSSIIAGSSLVPGGSQWKPLHNRIQHRFQQRTGPGSHFPAPSSVRRHDKNDHRPDSLAGGTMHVRLQIVPSGARVL